MSRKLKRLMRRDNAYWVEIEGFDEFMAELHRGLGLTLPDAVRDPYKATTERLNTFILPKAEIKHPVIKEDIAKLEDQVKGFEQVISGEAPREEFDRLVPYRFLGDMEFERKNYENALLHYENALFQAPNDLSIMDKMALSYVLTENFEKTLEMSERMITQAPGDFRGYWRRGQSLVALNKAKEAIASYDKALKYITEETKSRALVLESRSNALLVDGNWEEAFTDTDKALKLAPENDAALLANKFIALRRLGKEEEAEEAKKVLQDILTSRREYPRACISAVLGDRENMLEELEAAIKKDRAFRVIAKIDPKFAGYREDPDFQKLVCGGQE